MAKFTLTEGSELTPAQVKRLKASFTRIEAKAEKLRPLEKKVIAANAVIEKYLEKLYELGEEFQSELSHDSDQFLVNGDEIYFGDYPEAAIANAFDFWIPSSMSC